jgi:hypothetical protein
LIGICFDFFDFFYGPYLYYDCDCDLYYAFYGLCRGFCFYFACDPGYDFCFFVALDCDLVLKIFLSILFL